MKATTLRWWRQVGIVLLVTLVVGAIAGDVIDNVDRKRVFVVRIANGENLPAKSSNVFRGIWKHIKVFGPSPHVHKFAPGLYVQNIFYSNWSACQRRPQASPNEILWRYKRSTNGSSVIVESKLWRQGRIANDAFRMHSHILSRRVTAILPFGTESPAVRFRARNFFPKVQQCSGENKGSFSCNHCIACDIGGPPAFSKSEVQEDYLRTKSYEL